MGVSVKGSAINSSSPMNLLPSVCSVIALADSQDRADWQALQRVKEEPMDVETLNEAREEVSMHTFRTILLIFAFFLSLHLTGAVFPLKIDIKI